MIGTTMTDAAGNYGFADVAVGFGGVSVHANVNVSKGLGPQAEPAIAIDPSNPKRLFAAANASTDAGVGLFGAYTTDGGATWIGRPLATGTDGLRRSWSDPTLAFDSYGNLFIAYVDFAKNAIDVGWSTNGGQSFANLTQVALAGAVDQPTLVTGPGGLLDDGSTSPAAVWIALRDNNQNIAAFGAPIRGSGATLGAGAVGGFTVPLVVPTSAPGNYGDIAIGPDGQVVVAYQRTGTGPGPSTIFTSMNPLGLRAARAFQTPVAAFTTQVGDLAPIPAFPARPGRPYGIDAEAGLAYDLSTGPHRGRLYLVYTDRTSPTTTDTRIDLISSDLDGRTGSWSTPASVSGGGLASSAFFPRIAVDASSADPGTVAVTWLDTRNDFGDFGPGDTNGIANDDVELFGAVSVNGGSVFSTNEQIASAPSNALADPDVNQFGDYAGLAFYGGAFYPIWADNSNSTGPQPAGDNPNGRLNQTNVYTAHIALLWRRHLYPQ